MGVQTLLSIDPGLDWTGWAVWVGTSPMDWGLITPKDIATTSWKLVAQIMATRVRNLAVRLRADSVVCEMPEEFQSAKGQAALHSGAVRKLAYYVGLVGGFVLCESMGWATVEPMKWKGNIPKELTQKRVRRDYSMVPGGLRPDVYDALGIGRYWLRRKVVHAEA